MTCVQFVETFVTWKIVNKLMWLVQFTICINFFPTIDSMCLNSFQIYPNERHGIRQSVSSEHYETMLLSFLQKNL